MHLAHNYGAQTFAQWLAARRLHKHVGLLRCNSKSKFVIILLDTIYHLMASELPLRLLG